MNIKSDYGNKECEILGWIELARRSSSSSCEVHQGSPTSIHWRATRVSTCIEIWGGGELNLLEHRYLERRHLYYCCLFKLPYRPLGLL